MPGLELRLVLKLMLRLMLRVVLMYVHVLGLMFWHRLGLVLRLMLIRPMLSQRLGLRRMLTRDWPRTHVQV